MKKKQLPLVGLLLAAVAALLWLAWPADEAGDGEGVDEGVVVAPGPRASDPSRGTAEELTSVAAPDAGRTEAMVAPRAHAAAEQGPAASARSFDEAAPDDVEVVVSLPPGTPADPTLAVLAIYPGEGESFDEDDVTWRASSILESLAKDYTVHTDAEWAYAPIPASLRVRVPRPGTATGVHLCLRGRFVSDDGEWLDTRGASPIVLTPVVGGWVTGRFLVPPEAADRGIDADRFAVTVTSRSRDGKGGGEGMLSWGREREDCVHADLSYELRALSPEKVHAVDVRVDGLLDHRIEMLEVAAGEHRVLDVSLRRGASILGRVTDEGGSGISGVDVETMGDRRRLRSRSSATASTDEDGRFALHGLSAGAVRVQASIVGMVSPEPETVLLEEEQVLTGHDIVLLRGNRVGGVVLWNDEPVPRARVVVHEMARSAMGGMRRQQVGSATTGEDGRFQVQGLGDGPFEVVANLDASPHSGHGVGVGWEAMVETITELPASPTEVVVQAEDADAPPDAAAPEGPGPDFRGVAKDVPPETLDLAILLEPPLTIVGRVLDDAGNPLASFAIEAVLSEGNVDDWSAPRTSDAFEEPDGTFALTGVYPGEWSVTAEAPGFADMEEPVRITIPQVGDPLVFVLERNAVVSGRVLDPAGAPVAGAAVFPDDRDNPFGMRFGDDDVKTNDEGRFTLEDLPPGALSLVANHDDWARSEAVLVEPPPGASVDDVVLRLRVGGRITGEVFDDEGEPIENQNVVCGGMMFGMGGVENTTLTDAAGRFSFDHVDPGKVTVAAMPSEEEMMSAVMDSGDEDDGGAAVLGFMSQMKMETVEVVDGQEVHVVLGSEPKAPVRVYGEVREGGARRTGGQIIAFAEGGAMFQGMKLAEVDEEGGYELTVDRPGDYVFSYVLDMTEGSGIQVFVTVPEAEEYRFDIDLPTGRITGRVFDPKGSPAVGVSLRLSSEGGVSGLADFDQSHTTTTDEEGNYAFGSLTTGSYAVHVGSVDFVFGGGDARYGATVVAGIQVRDGDEVGGVDIHLTGAGTLTGVVRDAQGRPVSGASVFVRDGAGRLISNVSSTMSGAGGEYTVAGLAPGPVTASAHKGDLTCSAQGPVVIAEGESVALDLQLSPGAMLEVSLLEDGEPVRARLRVLDEAGHQVNGMVSLSDIQTMVTEGFSSKVRTVGPVPPGEYTVIATTDDGSQAKKTVRVREGQTSRAVKLRLK